MLTISGGFDSFIWALDQLACARADRMLFGAYDELTDFLAWALNSSVQSRKYSLVEAAAVAVVEPFDQIEARGEKPLAEILGYGSAAYFEDAGYRLSMQRALETAQMQAADIDLIFCADSFIFQEAKDENKALRFVFDPVHKSSHIHSTKKMFGESLSVSGVIASLYGVELISKNATAAPKTILINAQGLKSCPSTMILGAPNGNS